MEPKTEWFYRRKRRKYPCSHCESKELSHTGRTRLTLFWTQCIDLAQKTTPVLDRSSYSSQEGSTEINFGERRNTTPSAETSTEDLPKMSPKKIERQDSCLTKRGTTKERRTEDYVPRSLCLHQWSESCTIVQLDLHTHAPRSFYTQGFATTNPHLTTNMRTLQSLVHLILFFLCFHSKMTFHFYLLKQRA